MGQINDLDTESLQGDWLSVLTPAVAPASLWSKSPVKWLQYLLFTLSFFTNKCKVKRRCTWKPKRAIYLSPVGWLLWVSSALATSMQNTYVVIKFSRLSSKIKCYNGVDVPHRQKFWLPGKHNSWYRIMRAQLVHRAYDAILFFLAREQSSR